MPRCHLPALATPRAGSAARRPAIASVTAVNAIAAFTLALPLALALGAAPAQAQSDADIVPLQLSRVLPPTSLRGELLFSQPPEVVLNGKTAARLAPGARVRGENNLLVMWGMLIGKKLKVNYTLDSYGLLMDVWILRPDELDQRWPTTAEQAAAWTYDPITKTWSK